jgi:hypothetical protein
MYDGKISDQVCNSTEFYKLQTFLDISKYNNRAFEPWHDIIIKTEKSWDRKDE